MSRRTADALIVPLMVMAFCHDETGPSVTGTGASGVPDCGAPQPFWFCDAALKVSSLNTGFGMVRQF